MQNTAMMEKTAPQGWMHREATSRWTDMGNITVVLLVLPFCLLAIWGICRQQTANAPSYAMLSGISIALLFLLSPHVEMRSYTGAAIVFTAALLLRLFFLLVWSIAPADDFALSYHLAAKIAAGNAQAIHAAVYDPENLYATVWSVHMPFVLTEAGLLRLFGGGVLSLQLCFSVCSAVTCLLTERITGALADTRTGWCAGMMMALNPTALYFTSVLSNQHAALMFCLLAVWFFLARPLRHDRSNALAAGLALTVSNLLRPEMLVVLIAFVCYSGYHALCQETLRQMGKLLLHRAGELVIIAALFFGSTPAVSALLLHAGLIRQPMTQPHTAYKLAVGLNADSLGKWNAADAEIEHDESALRQRVRERLSHPRRTLWLAAEKTKYQFGVYDYCWSGREDASPKQCAMRNGLCQSWMFVVLLLFTIGTVSMAFTKRTPLLPLLVIVLGYFLVFALIEVQDRYNYLLLPFFSAVAAWGLCRTGKQLPFYPFTHTKRAMLS